MAAVILGGAVMGLVVVTAVTAARGELNVTAPTWPKSRPTRPRARNRRLRVPPQRDTNYWTAAPTCLGLPRST